MKRIISLTLLALLGFLMKVISSPKKLFAFRSENLEIERRLESIGNLK